MGDKLMTPKRVTRGGQEVAALVTPEELSERLQVSLRTLAKWRTRHQGPPYINLGGRRGLVRYHSEAVEQWLAEQARHAGGAA